MICTKCQTENEPNSAFCLNCGKSLKMYMNEGETMSTNRYTLFYETIKFIFLLLGLYLIRTILTSLQFVNDINIPDFPITVTEIISAIIGLIILVLVIVYATGFPGLWASAFPATSEVGKIITSFLYIIVLSVLYKGLLPLIAAISDASELYLILQTFFLIIAIILSTGIISTLNQALPKWINGFRFWIDPSAE